MNDSPDDKEVSDDDHEDDDCDNDSTSDDVRPGVATGVVRPPPWRRCGRFICPCLGRADVVPEERVICVCQDHAVGLYTRQVRGQWVSLG